MQADNDGSNDGLVWVFGYASLMWKTDFEVARKVPALLEGYHRALCVWSWHWRGTQERPGLVMGLAPGLECHGMALGVPAEQEEAVLANLDERELVTAVYTREKVPLKLEDGSEVQAWAYVVVPDHEQYQTGLSAHEMAQVIRDAAGKGGPNSEYLANTLQDLRRMNITDDELEAVAKALDAMPEGHPPEVLVVGEGPIG